MRALVTATLLACLPALALAQESRVLRPIPKPAAPAALPAGAVRISPPQPVARERVEAAVEEIARAWSERKLDAVLAPVFYDRERLVQALETQVPRDARLRVTAIQGWQVVDQYRIGGAIVSELSVTVRTQVEYNDPAGGLQVRDGTNDWMITLGSGVR